MDAKLDQWKQIVKTNIFIDLFERCPTLGRNMSLYIIIIFYLLIIIKKICQPSEVQKNSENAKYV